MMKALGYPLAPNPQEFFFDPKGMFYDEERWNAGWLIWHDFYEYIDKYRNRYILPKWFPTTQSEVNCTAYAFNMEFDPITGKNIPVRQQGVGYGLQPQTFLTQDDKNELNDDLGIYLAGDKEGDEAFIRIMQRNLEYVGLDFIPVSEIGSRDTSTGYKVYLRIDPDNDYHWYRQDVDGTWSDKVAEAALTQRDPNGGSYPHSVGEFWVLPKTNYNMSSIKMMKF